MDGRRPRLDRDSTDQSLQSERTSTDEAIEERRLVGELDADLLIARARGEADSVLEAARDRADRTDRADRADRADRSDPSDKSPSLSIQKERILADRILDDERAAADEQIRSERQEHARLLAALMPLERRKTDRDLLTERARSDARLAHRDDFLGMVSHDLRSLLCGILLESSSLAEEMSDSPEGRRTRAAVLLLQQYTARMNRLIGDLIDVVSIDAGKLRIVPQVEDTRALLAEAVAMFEASAAEKGVRLEYVAAPLGLRAPCDHDRIFQVLANLISNALKFTPPGGKVVLRGDREGGAVHLSVSDSGSGIPAAMLKPIFERFWQVGEDDQRGLGLGLHIARCIVDAHGGRIWAESALGAGSTFHFTLPASAAD
jgi:signal transduction histidine kinase